MELDGIAKIEAEIIKKKMDDILEEMGLELLDVFSEKQVALIKVLMAQAYNQACFEEVSKLLNLGKA